MLRKSATHQKKVDSAVWILQTTTGVKVPGAMILAGFSKSAVQAKSCASKYNAAWHKMVVQTRTDGKLFLLALRTTQHCCLTWPPRTMNRCLLLTTTASSSSAPMNSKPKRKQIRPTASAFQQWRVDNLVSKHCPQAMQDLTWEAGERQDIAWAPGEVWIYCIGYSREEGRESDNADRD